MAMTFLLNVFLTLLMKSDCIFSVLCHFISVHKALETRRDDDLKKGVLNFPKLTLLCFSKGFVSSV